MINRMIQGKKVLPTVYTKSDTVPIVNGSYNKEAGRKTLILITVIISAHCHIDYSFNFFNWKKLICSHLVMESRFQQVV